MFSAAVDVIFPAWILPLRCKSWLTRRANPHKSFAALTLHAGRYFSDGGEGRSCFFREKAVAPREGGGRLGDDLNVATKLAVPAFL